MSTLTIQIAVLDAAAESLHAVAGAVSTAGEEALAAVATMAGAVPGSAVQEQLPGVPIEALTTAVRDQCAQIAQQVAAGAQTYRDMEAALADGITSAQGTARVPR